MKLNIVVLALLFVMERNGSVSRSKKEVARLKNSIEDVEKVLFAKKSKLELELK